jgi:hypothetical protein
MSNETKTPKPSINPTDPRWQRWLLEMRVTIDDQDAVLQDLLRKERHRDLGVREAKRLYRETRDKLRSLLAHAGGGDGGDGGDESGRDPAGSGGSPAH